MATMATMAKLWFFYKIYHYYKIMITMAKL